MNRYQIVAAAILLCSLSVLTTAGETPVFVSASEADGYILTELLLPKDSIIGPGSLSYWLFPTGAGCLNAEFLGWQVISPGSGEKVTMKTVVPEGLTPGNYQIRVMHNPYEGKVVPCDSGYYAEKALQILTPGKAGRDISGILSDANGSGSGPRYRIDSLNGIDTAIRVNPGETLSPLLTITNTGADDTSDTPVEVHGYFGSHELIPAGATVRPLKSGESATVTPAFTIPETISLKGYPFFVILDPMGIHGPASQADNLKQAPGQVGFKIEAPDIGCGCK